MLLLDGSAALAASAAPSHDAWSSAIARRGLDPALVPNPIDVTPEVKAAAAAVTGAAGGTIEELKRIQAALFDKTKFTFDYDAGLTETASEALASGHGNCVSFTNLFIAMGRARGLKVRAGYMTPHDNGRRRGDLVVLSTHVVAMYPLHDRFVVFDFYRVREDPTTQIRLLDDFELAALYVNNRAVEALAAGRYDLAADRLAAVLKLFPDFAAGYANLGVLERRRGDVAGALDAYRHALEIDPKDPGISSNLAALYMSLGRVREAKAAVLLADWRRATPFTLLARGDLEAVDGRYKSALRFYRQAARRDPKLAEPHAAMARVALATGRLDDARREVALAMALDPGNDEAAKILPPEDGDASR